MKLKRIAIDTSKHVFTLHGVDEQVDLPRFRGGVRSCVQDIVDIFPNDAAIVQLVDALLCWNRTMNGPSSVRDT